MTETVAIVTGASQGIGRATAIRNPAGEGFFEASSCRSERREPEGNCRCRSEGRR